MNYKRKILLSIALSILVVVFAFVLALPEKVGLCSPNDDLCIDTYIDNYNSIAGILISLLTPAIIILVILFFLSELVFNSWLRFAKYYLPIVAILIFLSPTIDSSILGFDKEFMTWVLSGIFFIVSLGIIIFKRR